MKHIECELRKLGIHAASLYGSALLIIILVSSQFVVEWFITRLKLSDEISKVESCYYAAI